MKKQSNLRLASYVCRRVQTADRAGMRLRRGSNPGADAPTYSSGWWPGTPWQSIQTSTAPELAYWGWMAVLFAVGNIALYFAALMCTHIAAFRTARNIGYAGVAHLMKLPLGFFTGKQSGQLRKIIDVTPL
ncbi:MAG: hypothetical protein V8R75_07160 [Oscillospiraceae bacterium]